MTLHEAWAPWDPKNPPNRAAPRTAPVLVRIRAKNWLPPVWLLSVHAMLLNKLCGSTLPAPRPNPAPRICRNRPAMWPASNKIDHHRSMFGRTHADAGSNSSRNKLKMLPGIRKLWSTPPKCWSRPCQVWSKSPGIVRKRLKLG